MYPRCNYRNLSLSSSVVYKERLIQIKIQFKRCLLFLPPPPSPAALNEPLVMLQEAATLVKFSSNSRTNEPLFPILSFRYLAPLPLLKFQKLMFDIALRCSDLKKEGRNKGKKRVHLSRRFYILVQPLPPIDSIRVQNQATLIARGTYLQRNFLNRRLRLFHVKFFMRPRFISFCCEVGSVEILQSAEKSFLFCQLSGDNEQGRP